MEGTQSTQTPNPSVETGESPKPTKLITKKLIQPFAVITFFYTPARVALDELSEYLTEWETKKERASAQGLYASFGILARAIKIHADHQLEGLYPEIKCFLENQLGMRRKHQKYSVAELNEALLRTSHFMEGHHKNIQMIGRNANCIAAFVKKVEQNRYVEIDQDPEIEEIYETVSLSVKWWIDYYRQLLVDEETFISPLLSNIATNKIHEIKIAKGIVELSRDDIILYQFGFIVSKMIKYTANNEWQCPESVKEGYEYTSNEILTAYIRSLQMVSTEEEYQEILKIIPKHIPSDIWGDLKLYGLDEPGLFRYTRTPTHWSIADTCIGTHCDDGADVVQLKAMELSDLRTALHDYVTTAGRSSDLYKMLQYLNLNDLKQFIDGQIDVMTAAETRSAYNCVLSINNVLPDDLLQHMLVFSDFDESSNNRTVCKQWNAYFKSNEETMLRNAYQSVSEKYPETLPQGNSTWVMHERRTTLHPIEKRLGFKGPVFNLDEVEGRCKSGDRVLVHASVSGDKEYGSSYWCGGYFKKGIHFIGVSSSPKDGHMHLRWNEGVSLLGHVILENMNVQFACDLGANPFFRDAPTKEEIGDIGPPKLTMRHCNVRLEEAIRVRDGTSLDIHQCRISGWGLAIAVSPWANTVTIKGNTIRGFHRGIAIQRVSDPTSDPCAQIKITNNVFEGIKMYAIYEQTDYRHNQKLKIKGTDRLELSGNQWNGAELCDDGFDDPNVMYHIEGDHCEYPSDSDFD